jgi:hypothetical protein
MILKCLRLRLSDSVVLGQIHRADTNSWQAPELEAWRACREALMTDADAVLPLD